MSLELSVTFQETLGTAIYYELIAHLEQLANMTVIPVRRSSFSFDYLASAIAHLRLSWQGEHSSEEIQLLLAVLGHYGKFTIASDTASY